MGFDFLIIQFFNAFFCYICSYFYSVINSFTIFYINLQSDIIYSLTSVTSQDDPDVPSPTPLDSTYRAYRKRVKSGWQGDANRRQNQYFSKPIPTHFPVQATLYDCGHKCRDVTPNANPNPNAPDARDFPDCEPGCISIMICQTASPDARKISRVRILDIQYRENGQGAWALGSNISRDVPNRSQSD